MLTLRDKLKVDYSCVNNEWRGEALIVVLYRIVFVYACKHCVRILGSQTSYDVTSDCFFFGWAITACPVNEGPYYDCLTDYNDEMGDLMVVDDVWYEYTDEQKDDMCQVTTDYLE